MKDVKIAAVENILKYSFSALSVLLKREIK